MGTQIKVFRNWRELYGIYLLFHARLYRLLLLQCYQLSYPYDYLAAPVLSVLVSAMPACSTLSGTMPTFRHLLNRHAWWQKKNKGQFHACMPIKSYIRPQHNMALNFCFFCWSRMIYNTTDPRETDLSYHSGSRSDSGSSSRYNLTLPFNTFISNFTVYILPPLQNRLLLTEKHFIGKGKHVIMIRSKIRKK
jgi:hypothetical protein